MGSNRKKGRDPLRAGDGYPLKYLKLFPVTRRTARKSFERIKARRRSKRARYSLEGMYGRLGIGLAIWRQATTRKCVCLLPAQSFRLQPVQSHDFLRDDGSHGFVHEGQNLVCIAATSQFAAVDYNG